MNKNSLVEHNPNISFGSQFSFCAGALNKYTSQSNILVSGIDSSVFLLNQIGCKAFLKISNPEELERSDKKTDNEVPGAGSFTWISASTFHMIRVEGKQHFPKPYGYCRTQSNCIISNLGMVLDFIDLNFNQFC